DEQPPSASALLQKSAMRALPRRRHSTSCLIISCTVVIWTAMRSPLLIVVTFAIGCNHPASADPGAEIGRVLDDWHDAAAHADEARYFGHFAPGGVFLGTDASERWDVAAFRAYAHPRF